MPLFSEASRIYAPSEVNLLRSCFARSAILLEEGGHAYVAAELAGCIVRLYESGLRDMEYISELAARLAHSKFDPSHTDTHRT